METCKVVLTFESADEIQWCDDSIEIFSAISFHGTLCSFVFCLEIVLKFDSGHNWD